MLKLKYSLSYIRDKPLDAMKVVIITYMISYSLNGHAQLSRRGWICVLVIRTVHVGVDLLSPCRCAGSFDPLLIAQKQWKFRTHLLRVQRCLRFLYSSTNSLQRILWSHNIGIVTRKPVFGCMPIIKAQTSVRIHADWSALLFFTICRYSIRTCTWTISVFYILCSEARQAGLSFMLL